MAQNDGLGGGTERLKPFRPIYRNERELPTVSKAFLTSMKMQRQHLLLFTEHQTSSSRGLRQSYVFILICLLIDSVRQD